MAFLSRVPATASFARRVSIHRSAWGTCSTAARDSCERDCSGTSENAAPPCSEQSHS